MLLYYRICLLVLVLSTPLAVLAQKSFITVSGISETVQINPSELKHIDLTAIGHDGKEHSYSGVAISDILLKAGINLADKARREALGSYVVLRAKDNYRVVFSLPELDPLFANKTIILADKVDGQSLDKNGPFQVVVPDEKLHARWIRQVVSIEVGRVK